MAAANRSKANSQSSTPATPAENTASPSVGIQRLIIQQTQFNLADRSALLHARASGVFSRCRRGADSSCCPSEHKPEPQPTVAAWSVCLHPGMANGRGQPVFSWCHSSSQTVGGRRRSRSGGSLFRCRARSTGDRRRPNGPASNRASSATTKPVAQQGLQALVPRPSKVPGKAMRID
jgi:hypothetical protein